MLGGRIGRGVGPRYMGRDGAIIDNSPPPGLLALHHLERFLGTQKGPGQVGVHDSPPLLVGQIFQGYARHAGTRIVKQ